MRLARYRSTLSRILEVRPIFAQAILNIWNGTSVSSLFEADSLAPIYEGMYARA